ncbi:hypothetical protein ACQEVI_19785 [Promicromonospora sp. CA-289599]|uniref:hypothetical protein n=1 Tax=Promicromonospora sp. CA-289599 TaxID=3240014 RepID=UPI003D9050F1
MDALGAGLRDLATAQTNEQLVDALWDLRDSAYDNPATWSDFTAEVFLQSLAAELEQDSGPLTTSTVVRALAKAVDPRPTRG